ncbi:MAG: glycine cleavage system aminomethyltransferase GcvT [Candidatus Obscuribacterales bacterium]|nr:glycine cleavage system aminomethyltransferase GcvT [Candidatus Obscuribacterales bacterium]
MTTAQLKQTPIASAHKELGARMVDFAGWYMPVQYKSIMAEHMAVRNKVGLFDVSHMGEFLVTGADAQKFVQYMVANDINKLNKPNMALYTQMLTDEGGTVDDLIVYRLDQGYLLVVNASNIEKDWSWLQENTVDFKSVALRDISEDTALLALQGPSAVELMARLGGDAVKSLPSFSYATGKLDGINAAWGRTGYTGEDGFEIFVSVDKAEKLWRKILEQGQSFGIEACGLGARDTLRLEAGLPLYGHELDENTSPLEAGLGWSVKLEKGDFMGASTLRAQKQLGLSKQLIGLKTEGKALPRQGYPVYDGEKRVGTVTSGSQGISVGYPIACAFVPPAYCQPGRKLQVEIREAKVEGEVVSKTFYKRK